MTRNIDEAEPLIAFDEILEDLFDKEGGYVNHVNDNGGATNLGVTIHTMRQLNMDIDGDGDVDEDDVRNLSRAEARDIYYYHYWLKANCDKVPDHMKHIYFDMVVNFGRGGAGRVIQQAANARWYLAIKNRKVTPLVVDGAVGPATLARLKPLETARIRAYRILRFAMIIENNPSQEVFWFGWFNRSMEV